MSPNLGKPGGAQGAHFAKFRQSPRNVLTWGHILLTTVLDEQRVVGIERRGKISDHKVL